MITSDLTPQIDGDVLEEPANTRTVRLLFAAGALNDVGRRNALQWLLGPLGWWQWIEKALLFLGLLLMRAGVVCFIAWNWADMPPMLKLGLIQAGIVGACGFALWKGLDTLIGKAAQTAAAALVGAFLATYGQIYQTGADAYELFVGWALLSLPWVIIARFDALWVLWLGLVNVAISLAWSQLSGRFDDQHAVMMTVLGVVNGTAAVTREWAFQRGCVWLKANWVRWVLVPATLVPLMVPTMQLIFEPTERQFLGAVVGTLCFAVAIAMTFGYFRYRVRDLFVLTCVVASVGMVIDSIFAHWLIDFRREDALKFLVLGLVIVVTVGLGAMWLRRIAKVFRAERVHSGVAQVLAPEESQDRPIRHLLAALISSQDLAEQDIPKVVETLRLDGEEHAPWFIQTLVTMGAWMACLCFLVGAGIARVFDSSESTLVMACVLGVAAFGLERLARGHFFQQLGLALAFTSYGSFLIALKSNDIETYAMVSVVLSAISYVVFRSQVLRFAVASIPQILMTAAFLKATPNGVHVLVLAQTIGIGAIFLWRPQRVLWPLGYSLVLGLFGTLLLPLLNDLHLGSGTIEAWPSSVVQAVAEVVLLAWLLGSSKQESRGLIVAAALAAALLGALSVPGVLAAVGVVVVGHWERDGVLRALGIAFLPLYLLVFYFNLDTSLLFKSGTLIASGSILWASRFYVSRQVALLKVRSA